MKRLFQIGLTGFLIGLFGFFLGKIGLATVILFPIIWMTLENKKEYFSIALG